MQLNELKKEIKQWAADLGFIDTVFTNATSSKNIDAYKKFLMEKFNGEMHFLEKNLDMRYNPVLLFENTVSIICFKLPYKSFEISQISKSHASIAHYALRKDYHKVIRKKLSTIIKKINDVYPCSARAFSDSAPILEKDLAERASTSFTGKNTLLIHPKLGSFFLLGEIFINLPFAFDEKPITNHCGTCTKCINFCPTNAIKDAFVLDATRCIAYLTIEYKGVIPENLRHLIGNKIFGCDDCQICCPFNKFSKITKIDGFLHKEQLLNKSLLELFLLGENDFLKLVEGTPIKRISFEIWQRNLIIAIGNASFDIKYIDALTQKLNSANEFLTEHINWAISNLYKNKHQKHDCINEIR